MLRKTMALSLACIVTLLGCGGGGGKGETGGGTPLSPPPPTGAFFADSPLDYSIAALDTLDSMLQLGFMANNLVSLSKGTVSGVQRVCQNGGIVVSSYSDDEPELHVGEVISIELSDCFRPEINDTVDGTLSVEIQSYNAATGMMSFNTTFEETAINSYGELLIVAGDMTIASTANSDSISVSLDIDNDFGIYAAGDIILSIGALSIEHVRNKLTAKYALSGSASLLETNAIDAFKVLINEPFVGYFEEYPHEGKLTLSSPVSNDLVVTANFVTDSAFYNYAFSGNTELSNWSYAVEGAMWSSDTQVTDSNNATEYRADNFISLGVNNPNADSSISVFSAIEFYFSRPVARIEVDNAYFESFASQVDNVDAVLDVNGAVVTVMPTKPLEPGTEYTLPGFRAYDALGQSVSIVFPTFYTSTEALADIQLSHYFANRSDIPTLTVEGTFANNGEVQQVSWQELSDYGVTFIEQEVNSVALDLSDVPEDTNEIVILAEVQSNNGLTAYTSKEIIVLPKSDTLLAIVSDRGDWVGQGRSMSYDENEGVFEIASYSTSNYIHFRFEATNTYDYWTLDFQAPEGQDLEVGVYENATRYPFQLGLAPGLDYSGNHRGCNRLYGEFEILEIEFEDGTPTKLAVDWIQYCEAEDAPPSRGVLRYNSTAGVSQ